MCFLLCEIDGMMIEFEEIELMKPSFSESDIQYLNKLRKENPEAFSRKLRILGINDSDVPYITLQNDSQKQCEKSHGHRVHDPYKYSWERDDNDFE